MLTRMNNHKFIEAWVSYICGVFGYGFVWTNVDWADALPKIFISMASAALAGGMGYLGKLLTVALVRKGKLFIHKLKEKYGRR